MTNYALDIDLIERADDGHDLAAIDGIALSPFFRTEKAAMDAAKAVEKLFSGQGARFSIARRLIGLDRLLSKETSS